MSVDYNKVNYNTKKQLINKINQQRQQLFHFRLVVRKKTKKHFPVFIFLQ